VKHCHRNVEAASIESDAGEVDHLRGAVSALRRLDLDHEARQQILTWADKALRCADECEDDAGEAIRREMNKLLGSQNDDMTSDDSDVSQLDASGISLDDSRVSTTDADKVEWSVVLTSAGDIQSGKDLVAELGDLDELVSSFAATLKSNRDHVCRGADEAADQLLKRRADEERRKKEQAAKEAKRRKQFELEAQGRREAEEAAKEADRARKRLERELKDEERRQRER